MSVPSCGRVHPSRHTPKSCQYDADPDDRESRCRGGSVRGPWDRMDRFRPSRCPCTGVDGQFGPGINAALVIGGSRRLLRRRLSLVIGWWFIGTGRGAEKTKRATRVSARDSDHHLSSGSRACRTHVIQHIRSGTPDPGSDSLSLVGVIPATADTGSISASWPRIREGVGIGSAFTHVGNSRARELLDRRSSNPSFAGGPPQEICDLTYLPGELQDRTPMRCGAHRSAVSTKDRCSRDESLRYASMCRFENPIHPVRRSAVENRSGMFISISGGGWASAGSWIVVHGRASAVGRGRRSMRTVVRVPRATGGLRRTER